MPRQAEPTAIDDLLLPIHHPMGQARQAEYRLDGGAGGVLAVDGAVHEGLVPGTQQGAVVLGVDAGDKDVRVVARLADQGEHAARVRVDGNHRAAPVAQGLIGDRLQVDVQVQPQIPANDGGVDVQGAAHPSKGVGLHPLSADLAMQRVFIEALNAALADEVGTAVAGAVHGVQVLLGDAAD